MLIDTRYRNGAIERMATVCEESELGEWLELGGAIFAGLKISKDWRFAIDMAFESKKVPQGKLLRLTEI